MNGAEYEKYQVTGPRYTSYPSANRFHGGFGADAWAQAARATNSDLIPAPLSLYVHVPFCPSPCFFCGCTRIITRDPAMAKRYIDYLRREIAMQGSLFDPDRVVEQIHFGGGTPSTLREGGLDRVMAAIRAHFNVDDGPEREFGIELDPRHADDALLDTLRELGFNRVSLGVQDFDPKVQAAVNRLQDADATLALLDAARVRGFQAINVDLICGLPHQTLAGFGKTIEQVVAHRPDRIALYSYAHLPELFKAQRQINAVDLPKLNEKLQLLRFADDTLTTAGYVMIGMDHYALPTDPLARGLADGSLQRNFQGYSTHGYCDMVGLGVSGISMLDECYAQNNRGLAEYYTAIDLGRLPVARGLALTHDDRLRRELIQTLMCTGRVEFAALDARYGIRSAEYFADELKRLRTLADDGLVDLDDEGFVLLPAGRPVMRVVAMVFDAYLAQDAGRFSKVV